MRSSVWLPESADDLAGPSEQHPTTLERDATSDEMVDEDQQRRKRQGAYLPSASRELIVESETLTQRRPAPDALR